MKYLSEKEEKFDSIYRSYEDDVFKFCLHLAKDYDVAQDLAQQTFINFYNHFECAKPENIPGYLSRTAKNLYINYLREAKRGVSLQSIPENHTDSMLSTDSLETEYLENCRKTMEKELSDKILDYLRKEHGNWYEIFDKMYFEDKSYEEISSELGITEDALYSRIYRAKRCIRKQYEKTFRDISDPA